MGSNKLAPAPGIDPGAAARATHIVQASPLSPTCGGLVQSNGGSTAVSLEFMSFHELGSAVSVDLSIVVYPS